MVGEVAVGVQVEVGYLEEEMAEWDKVEVMAEIMAAGEMRMNGVKVEVAVGEMMVMVPDLTP